MEDNRYDVITAARFDIGMICKYDDRYGNFLATYGDTKRLKENKASFKFSDVIRLVQVAIEDEVGGEAAAMALINDYTREFGIDALLEVYADMIDDFFQMFLRPGSQDEAEQDGETEETETAETTE